MIIYDVAISFAGEDRKTAKQLANALKKKGIKVFYDNDERSNLLGKDLFQYLYKIYNENALFFIPLISEHYIEKPWAVHELKAAQEREFNNNDDEYILPIIMDETKVPAIPTTKGYLDLRVLSVNRISTIIYEKVINKNDDVFYKKKKLYNSIMQSAEFLVNRFCILSQTSKVAEFSHLPAIISIFKETIQDLNNKYNDDFFKTLLMLLELMKIEETDHIVGIDDNSLVLKQAKIKHFFSLFYEAYQCFEACRYSDDFSFLYFMNTQIGNQDKIESLANTLSEMIDYAMQEELNPITAEQLYQECIKIVLINKDVDLDDEDISYLVQQIPKELLSDFENSERINQDVFDELRDTAMNNQEKSS